MLQKNLVIIGGGAAGFFCAVKAAAASPHLKVTLLEKTTKLLSKVKVSGGGRCNVTHACFSIAEMIKKYPRGEKFLKKSFRHFFTTDTISWFEQRGVQLKAEPDGRMFPTTDNSQTIIDCLLNEASKHKVNILMQADVGEIQIQEGNRNTFLIHLKNGTTLQADYVCVACGGFAKASQFDWLIKLGHSIALPVPSLFTFNMPKHKLTALMGVVCDDAMVHIAGTKLQERGPVLVTHWGLSGPAILKLSAWGAEILAEKNYSFNIRVNWCPQYHENNMLTKLQSLRFDLAAQKIVNRNPFALPGRLWEFLLNEAGINPELRWADLPAKAQNKLAKILCAYSIDVKGKTTFKEEFVTAGGIMLDEIDAHTMQSKKIPGLFFAGEIMNVDGITGGFNFQHAWTSGWIAGKSIAEDSSL